MTRPLASARRLAAALAAAMALAGAAPSAGRGPLPFIEDNYSEALAQARAKKLPIFVEAWAPW